MSINEKRTESFKKKSDADLAKIAKSGSLGAAAAIYELERRGRSYLTVGK